jgi:hypothetical protein
MIPIRHLAVLLILTALSGCESASDRALKNSPDYKTGYSDGCTSAGSQGADMRDNSRVRDEPSYQANRAYRTGWDTGFNACRGYQGTGNMPATPGQGPIPDPTTRPF